MSEAQHLVRMANQIADNFSYHDDAAARVADHLGRFWAPTMRRTLMELAQSGQAEIDPVVREALNTLDAR